MAQPQSGAAPVLEVAMLTRKEALQLRKYCGETKDKSPRIGHAEENAVLTKSVLEQIARGESSAVEDCLKRYGGLVWSLARRLVADDTELDDAVQEIFIELWQAASKYDSKIASESTFITMIARRHLIDRYRRRKTNPALGAANISEAQLIAVSERNQVETEDEAAKAAICFQRLSKNAQEVIRLAVHHGESHSTIATRLSMPLGSVKSFARRGLLQLRECMRRTLPTLGEGVKA